MMIHCKTLGKWRSLILILLATAVVSLVGFGGYSIFESNKQLNQGLVIPGNEKTYTQAIGQSYRLLVERYVVPVSPKLLYQSAVETMELIEQNWLKDQKKIGEAGQKTILQWEQEAHFAADPEKAESARAPKRVLLSEGEKQRQEKQFAEEYLEYSAANLEEAYKALLSKSRLEGFYSQEFAKEVYTEVLAALCRPLRDPFSGFFQDSGFYQLSDTTNGAFGGVGLYITKQFRFTRDDTPNTSEEISEDAEAPTPQSEDYQYLQQHYVKVSRPFPGGPSFRSGIMADDFIYAVDEKSAKDWSVEQVQNTVRGVPGSKVKITVLRVCKYKMEFEVVREKIEIPAVNSGTILAKAADGSTRNILYVDLSQFNALASKQFEKQVKDLLKNQEKDSSIPAMILDMRNNPGGLLNVAVEIADQFLSEGLVVSTDARTSDNILEFNAQKGVSIPRNLPVYVMVNSESASAAEIVAGALQDNQRAEVLGEKSFGKGSVQVPITLPEGILKITIAHFYTPKGVNLANNGIVPNHEFQLPKFSEAEQEDLVKLLGDGLITNFVSQNHDYTNQEFQDFFDKEILKQYKVPAEAVKRIAHSEKMRYQEDIPVYDLEYDTILRDAVEYITQNIR